MLRRTLALAGASLACLAAASTASADSTSSGNLRLVKVGDFKNPDFVTAPEGDAARLFVVERGGSAGPARIVVVDAGVTSTFIDLSSLVKTNDDEEGLLSMAFAPDYATSGRFYVYYTRKDDGAIQIDEFTRSAANPDKSDLSSRRAILTEPHPSASNHNGGQLEFGPDGMLYAGLGDGGNGNDSFLNAQNLGTLRGKLIRIDPRGGTPYAIPADNPFVGKAGARGEIYAYGLRNPFRFSFDQLTGDLAIGDVGQESWEEVDFAAAGQARGVNFGWSLYEGNHTNSEGADKSLNPAGPYVPPVLERSHDAGYCSLIGGYVVRDPSVAQLTGRYLFSDFCGGNIESAVLAPGSATAQANTGLTITHLDSFGEDGRCRIHVASLDGPVYRLETVAPPATPAACPAVAGPAVPGAPAPAPAPRARDRIRPVISAVRLSRTRFAVGRAATAIDSAAAARGTVLRYRLSEAAGVTIRIGRLLPGRRVGKRCLVATRARRTRAHCTRLHTVGTLTRRRKAGSASDVLTGRIGKRAMLPGSYRASVRGRDAAGNVSLGHVVAFTIVRG